MLSRFDPATISDFVRNYDSFRREMQAINVHPSEMVLDALSEYWQARVKLCMGASR